MSETPRRLSARWTSRSTSGGGSCAVTTTSSSARAAALASPPRSVDGLRGALGPVDDEDGAPAAADVRAQDRAGRTHLHVEARVRRRPAHGALARVEQYRHLV